MRINTPFYASRDLIKAIDFKAESLKISRSRVIEICLQKFLYRKSIQYYRNRIIFNHDIISNPVRVGITIDNTLLLKIKKLAKALKGNGKVSTVRLIRIAIYENLWRLENET